MLPKNEVKYIQSLHHKKFREQYGFFIAEGPKVITELINRQPGWIQKIYGTEEWKFAQTETVWQIVEPSFLQIESFELEKISALQTPQQVLAIVVLPQAAYEPDSDWLLILDGIQDPGNFGTIVRTAHWFGIYQIVCSFGCADNFSPKVVQASMGSIFQVNVIHQDLAVFLSSYTQPVYGASLDGEKLTTLKMAEPGAIIIGSEGRGISQNISPFITQKITITWCR